MAIDRESKPKWRSSTTQRHALLVASHLFLRAVVLVRRLSQPHMQHLTERRQRQRSDSPTGFPASRILEWNFFSSRINEIVTVLRAYKRLRLPVNMQGLADGLQIERVNSFLYDDWESH